jgi:hypothetical protein
MAAGVKASVQRLLRAQKRQEVLDYLRDEAEEEHEKKTGQRNRVVSVAATRERLFLQDFNNIVESVFKDKVIPSKYALAPHKEKKSRALNLVLSDLHFHSMLDPREVPMPYGKHEEARRLAAVILQTAEHKRDHREETVLHVHIIGDIIQGQLHDARDGAPLAEQCGAAIYLLSQAVSYLSSKFTQVQVHCTPGNHGRNTMRHQERATNQKWDSIETIIYSGIKAAMRSLPNVTVEIPYTPYYSVDLFGSRAFFTHGDTVLNPGYPGKTIDVAGVRKQINEINARLTAENRYQLFAVGHVHVGSVTHLPGGAIFMSNGCLIPPDAYALSIGIMDTSCGQWLFESVKGHVLGDHRFISVDENTDKDAGLEKIIKPFDGL